MVRALAALALLCACSWETPRIACAADNQCPVDLGCDVAQGICSPNPPPAGFTAAVTTDLNNPYPVVLTWPLRPDSSQYTVYRGASASELVAIQEQPGNSTGFTDGTAAHGKTYAYALARMRNNSNGAESAKTAAITVAVPPDPPADTSVHLTATATTAHLVWDAAPGATDYEVVRYGDSTKTVLHVAATALDDTLVPEQVYSYTVAGRNQGNAGKPSRSAVVWSELAPTITGSDAGELIRWSVTYLNIYSGFDVFGSPDGAVWTLLQSNASTQYDDANPRPAGYFYKIVAKMYPQYLNATRETAPIRVPAAPQVTVAGGAGTAHVSWPAVAGADKYLVTGGSFTSAQAVTTAFIDDPAATGADYAVQAQIAGNSGKPGHVSLPPTPLLTGATGDSTIAVSWSPVAAATGFLLSISENGGAAVVQQASGTSYTQTGANLASSYTYTLQSKVGANSSFFSTPATLAAQPSISSIAGATDSGNAVFTVSVGATAGASGYYYQRSDDGGATFSTQVSGGATAVNVPAGPAGAAFRVQAYPASGNTFRNSVAVTPPGAPTAVATAGSGNTITWTAVTGADHYVVSSSLTGNAGAYTVVGSVTAPTLTLDDAAAPAAVSTFYAVQAVQGIATGLYSNEASAPAAGFTLGVSSGGFYGPVAAGDFTHDGVPDIITAYSSVYVTAPFTVSAGVGTQSLVNTGVTLGYPALVDLTADAKADLIVAEQTSCGSSGGCVITRLSNGDGTFGGANAHNVCAGPLGVVVKDLTGDNVPDLLVSCPAAHSLHYYQNIPAAGTDGFSGVGSPLTLTPPSGTSAPQMIAVGDFNGDLKMDAAVADYNGRVFIVSDVTNTKAVSSFAVTAGIYGIAAADMDGDGKLDLLVTNTAGTLTVYKGGGNLTFASASVTNLAGTLRTVVTADLDGDGKMDAVVASDSPGLVFVLYGDGLGGFKRRATFHAYYNFNAVLAPFQSKPARLDILSGGNVFFNTNP